MLEFYIQASNLNKIELVIITPLCYSDLTRWLTKRRFKFDQIKTFMIEISSALEHVAKIGLIHRDMKPDNVLISSTRRPTALLADFGLSKPGVRGLTPGFCAPEQLKKNQLVVGKTDIYAFGVTIIISLFKGESKKYGNDIGLALLFMPVTEIPPDLVKSLKQNKIVKLVREMVRYEPDSRPSFGMVRDQLEALDESETAVQLPVNLDIEELGQTMAQLSIVDRSVILPDRAQSKLVSAAVRDQKESGFCWAYSMAKLLAAEMRKFIKNLQKMKNFDKNLEEALCLADTLNEGDRLVDEIVCLTAGRNPKIDGISGELAKSQTADLKKRIQGLCSESLTRSEGWKQLPSLVNICKKIIAADKLGNLKDLKDFKLFTQTFHHPLSKSVAKALEPLMEPLGKPVWYQCTGTPFQDHILVKLMNVGAADQSAVHDSHAVLLEKCLTDSFQLKNSYPTDPVIKIPKNRKTFYQNHIWTNCKQFGAEMSKEKIEKIFAEYAAGAVEWNVENEWILHDEGYSLRFRSPKITWADLA